MKCKNRDSRANTREQWRPTRPSEGNECERQLRMNVTMKRNECASNSPHFNHVVRVTLFVIMAMASIGISAQTYKGKASYYGPGFHGRKCANGDVFDMNKLTCAHRTLPFGTMLKVTNTKNGKSTTVEVTDRGPYVKGRIVDLSKAAAKEIDMIAAGVVNVEIEVIKPEPEQPKATVTRYEPESNNELKEKSEEVDKNMEWAQTIR